MQKIGPWQMAILVVAGYLGLGIFQFPRELVRYAGPDALYAFAVELVGGAGVLWAFLAVGRALPREQLAGTLTKPGAIFVDGFRIVVHLALGATALANFGQVMRTFFLPGTPVWAIEAAMVGTALYTAWYDTPTLARSVQIVVLPTVGVSLLITVFVVPEMRYTWALLPAAHIGVGPIFKGVYHSAYVIIGIEAVAMLVGHVRPRDRKKASRAALVAYTLSSLYFVIGYIIALGTEGPYGLVRMQWPPVSALRLANIRGLLINKLGLLVVVLFGLFVLSFLAVRFWAMGHVFNPKASTTRYRWQGIAAAGIVLTAAQIPDNVVFISESLQRFVLPPMVVYLITFPFVVGLALALRRVIDARRRPRLVEEG